MDCIKTYISLIRPAVMAGREVHGLTCSVVRDICREAASSGSLALFLEGDPVNLLTAGNDRGGATCSAEDIIAAEPWAVVACPAEEAPSVRARLSSVFSRTNPRVAICAAHITGAVSGITAETSALLLWRYENDLG